MVRPPNRGSPRESDRRTGDQVRIDQNADDIAALESRVIRLERFVYWTLGAASAIGLVVGLFAKQIAHLILPGA